MDITSMYNDMIMEHNRSTKNRRVIENADHEEKGHNPSCGDEITVQIKFDGNTISDIAFTGTGCAISQASTSIMCDLIRGKSKKEAFDLVETFIGMIKKEFTDEEELEKLEDAIIFQNISNMPARIKCAVLAWHTLKESL